jgi:LacI family transcriptional regulator
VAVRLVATSILAAVQRVRLVDVAKAAGVHAATASRALNPGTRDQVNPQTVRRVEQAAHRLGYAPNTLARGLRTSRSYVATLVIPDITNPLFPPIVRGAEQVLSQAGFTLVLTDTNNDPGTERTQMASMRAHGVDGFIIATARWDDPALEELADSQIPSVLVNRRSSSGRLPFVGGDDGRGVELCVNHLVGLGHRAIVHLAGPDTTSTGRGRASAFRQAMWSRELGTEPLIIECDAYTEESGAVAAVRLLDSARPFTAVVAANDLLALGAKEALAERGVHCPTDVSITGFNDLPFMDKLVPPLTTVRLPLTELGATAARTLLEWIHAPEQRSTIQALLPVALIVRSTTGTAPHGRRRALAGL